MASGKLYSVGEVADRVNVAPSTLRFWEQRSEIPAAERFGLASVRGWDEASVAVIERKAEERRRSRLGKVA